MRPCNSSLNVKWVVAGLSYTHRGTDSSRVTAAYRSNTSSSVNFW